MTLHPQFSKTDGSQKEHQERKQLSLLRLAKIRTKIGQKRFVVQAALTYNNLTKNIGDEKSLLNFKTRIMIRIKDYSNFSVYW